MTERRRGMVVKKELFRGRVKRTIGKTGKQQEQTGYRGRNGNTEKMEKWIWEICSGVWEGKGWPKGWKEELIVPIRKKGEEREVGDYKVVTLMSSV